MNAINIRLGVITLLVAFALGGCTNMTKTQQGGLSGAAGGALVGAGISAISGGSGGVGAVVGGVLGGVAGSIYGHNQSSSGKK